MRVQITGGVGLEPLLHVNTGGGGGGGEKTVVRIAHFLDGLNMKNMRCNLVVVHKSTEPFAGQYLCLLGSIVKICLYKFIII